MTVVVTGAAGFIGYHTAEALLRSGRAVVGIDNVNDYYDTRLKEARLERLQAFAAFRFVRADIADRAAMAAVFDGKRDVTEIVHLAAQAGVRYSLIDPYAYVHSNVLGHLTLLEVARSLPGLRHFVYASSSSVYGDTENAPFRETDRADKPVSLYAATKRADELISHVYGHLHGIPQTGLRFFTAYGPWGRPDMAYFAFARAIVEGAPITIYDQGRLQRDFTYIDDVVAGVLAVLQRPPAASSPTRVLNVGNRRAESVAYLVELLERELGRKAIIRHAAREAADVRVTCASTDALEALVGHAPRTDLAAGIARFVAWFRGWHRPAIKSA
ncbi:SDR family NAD(P)-dependent oxidoreductase [Acidisphaera rubrifaciens]|uniref:UDP-N-acetylglucosamine 4-epimerase n=1 Tax=Acidisphaera rubrifaciens HS-AP3 TaxID=1231350 RepID=A0A0D6P301_9PROT|nr:SDR family NAD(P)-dependent oxidoreductase [Acidisphaera rubrifaciens]GAN76057.1 UDP-N-acetylglucosamine 4-epimerase [Acidisphaera rubrifaciens HS-AP3]